MSGPTDPAAPNMSGGLVTDPNAAPVTQIPQIGRAASFERLYDLPVTVAVTLAERRTQLGELLQLAPGTLLTFEKPCEELLDLYVGNQLVCRGEAVKVGDKFGLRITSMNARQERRNPVISSPVT
jgi:flagellar motor switch protein FliN/FliY